MCGVSLPSRVRYNSPMRTFAISATARSYPTLPYARIKDDILGNTYRLSLVFIGEVRARRLNMTYRKKAYAPNVLSFPLDRHRGEIFISHTVAKREAKRHNMTTRGYVGRLFIHGCLHLRGVPHGARMDTLEQKYLKKYRLL